MKEFDLINMMRAIDDMCGLKNLYVFAALLIYMMQSTKPSPLSLSGDNDIFCPKTSPDYILYILIHFM